MAQTKTKEGQAKVCKVEIELPEGFYDLLEKVCKVKDLSVNEFILDSLIMNLDSELQDNLGEQLGFELQDHDYRKDLEALAYPEDQKVAEEAQA